MKKQLAIAFLFLSACATDELPDNTPPLCSELPVMSKGDVSCNDGGLCTFEGQACCVNPCDLRGDNCTHDPVCAPYFN